MKVPFDLPIHEPEALLAQSGSGLGDHAQLFQVCVLPGIEPGGHQGVDIAGGQAEDRDPLLLQHLPDGVQIGIGRIPVVEHDGTARAQGGGLPVPHHPAAGGDIQHPIPGLHVVVEHQLLELVDEEPAYGLDHALGFARGAGGKHDHGGVVERPLFVDEGLRHLFGEEVLIDNRIRHLSDGRCIPGVMDYHHLLQILHAGGHLGGVAQGVEGLALIVVSVRGEQDLGGHLPQPIEGGAGTDIRGAGTPDAAHRRRGQHGDDGLGQVRQIRGHRVPGPHAQLAQGRGQLPGLLLHLPPAQHPADLILPPKDQTGLVVSLMPQQVLRIVETAAGEPFGPGEFMNIVHRPLIPCGMDDVQIPKQDIPKGLGLLHGEAIQLPIALIVPALLPVDQLHKGVHIGRLFHVLAGGPQQLAHRSLLFPIFSFYMISQRPSPCQ